MEKELRKSGISVVGDVPWGTHFCAFYETTQDLLDILVPFFKTGLENKEFCLWIISNSELLTIEEAKNALRSVRADLESDLSEGRIELAHHDQWFLNGDVFNAKKVAHRFEERLNQALAKGYDGMRVNGSPAWLCKDNDEELIKFEKTVDALYPGLRIVASCTYPIPHSAASALLSVADAHRFVITRRHGNWEILETPELFQAKAEIQRLNRELEQRVIERTRKLEETTARLRAEIEERKEAERAVRQSEERFAAFMDNLPGYAWMKDLEGRYVYINETFLQLRDAVGKTDAELWSAEIASTYRANDNQVIQTKNALQTIEPFPKDPEQGFQIVSKFPILDQDGAVVMVGGASVDITERIEAEAALLESEERFRELAENIDEVFWLSDLKHTTIFYVSPAYEKLWGRSCNSLYALPRSWMDAIHPEDRQRVVEILDDHELQSAPNMVYRIIRPDDSTRWVHSRGFPVHDENGAVVRVAGIAADITERKHAEEQLKATSEQLRALSASVQSAREEESKRIAREIHDELGGSLTSLRWDLEEVGEVIAKAKAIEHVAVLGERIAAMMSLTEATLDTVRRISSELRPTALDELGLVEAIEWQAGQFENRTGIAVQYDSSVEQIDLNNTQSTAVFRILQEALTNILRHAQATKVTILLKQEAGEFSLAIKDNGKGFTENVKSDAQSLGILGMRERAHLMGGEIKIESAEGRGTKIALHIPISS